MTSRCSRVTAPAAWLALAAGCRCSRPEPTHEPDPSSERTVAQGRVVGSADRPAALMRRAQDPSVYAYRFDWDEQPKKMGADLSVLLGAAHAMELPFVFDDVADRDTR